MDNLPRIHATQIQSYKRCPRAFYYSNRLKLRSKTPIRGLSVGGWGHRTLAAYYRGELQTGQELKKHFLDQIEEELDPATASELSSKFWNEVEHASLVLEGYPEWAEKQDALLDQDVLAVEEPFKVTLYHPRTDIPIAIHEGRFDLVTQDKKTGHIWLWDHKLLGRFTNLTLLRHDEQMGFYILAATELYEERVRGAIYNMLRKQNPNTARTSVYRRVEVLRPQSELQQLRWNMLHTLLKIMGDDIMGTWLPSPGIIKCVTCQYEELCMAENLGEDPRKLGPQLYDVVEPYAYEDEETA